MDGHLRNERRERFTTVVNHAPFEIRGSRRRVHAKRSTSFAAQSERADSERVPQDERFTPYCLGPQRRPLVTARTIQTRGRTSATLPPRPMRCWPVQRVLQRDPRDFTEWPGQPQSRLRGSSAGFAARIRTAASAERTATARSPGTGRSSSGSVACRVTSASVSAGRTHARNRRPSAMIGRS